MGRRQLPVSSTITARSLVRAIAPSVTGGSGARAALDAELRRAFGASSAALVDSGTSALAMAMRASTRAGGVVALPGYACVDVGAAAIFAQLRVRLYDVDPVTLSADLDSVSRVLAQGADTIVVSHLYGYAADVPGVAALAAAHGAAVIEDAAQGAWGTLLGKRLGSFGPLSVLSFGRGKGMTGGGGGALLGIGANVPGSLVTANEHLCIARQLAAHARRHLCAVGARPPLALLAPIRDSCAASGRDDLSSRARSAQNLRRLGIARARVARARGRGPRAASRARRRAGASSRARDEPAGGAADRGRGAGLSALSAPAR